MRGMTTEQGIAQVVSGGGHVVILGAGASIASTIRNPELHGKELPSMDNLIDVVGLSDIIAEVPEELRDTNFERLYGNLHNYDPDSALLHEIEVRIMTYFGDMQLPDEPTIYDYLVLSLRGRDVIATFNWDPFLYQAWTRNRECTENRPNLIFLHGNVAIGYCAEENRTGPPGYQLREDGGIFEPTQLLFPVEKKNYNSDKFTSREWDRMKRWMSKESKAVQATIFGYGAPVSDVEAVSLLNEAWGSPDDRPMEQIEVIDITQREILRQRWNGFIHSHHYNTTDSYFQSSLARNPRRTSESYFCHYMPKTPSEAFRNNNPIPEKLETLDALWEWHRPLIEAELASGVKE